MPDQAPESKAAAKKYWAFISYSHQDKRVAVALQQRLARAAIPKALRARVRGAHPTMRAVFRDEAEVAAGALDDRLRAALDESSSLIVVCSPFSAASSYCLAEIAHFLATGRGDRIFCLVASGQPNATDAGAPHLECFSAALRFHPNPDGFPSATPLPAQDRPLAAVLGMETRAQWSKALDQIVAGVLGLTQSELRSQRQRAVLTRSSLATAAGLFGLACAGVAWDGLYRPHTRYFQEVIRRDGAPQGVIEVSAAAQKQRAFTYALETRGRWSDRVVAMRALNGSGACPQAGLPGVLGYAFTEDCGVRRSCSASFTYRRDGSLEREELRDAAGAPLERLIYAGPTVGQFYEAEFPCTREGAGIKFVRFTRVADGPNKGLDEDVRFLGEDRSPRPNKTWAFGYRYERDARGRVTARTALGPTGAALATRDDKTARIAYKRDVNGQIIGLARFDADGAPTRDTLGVHREEWRLDSVGNVVARLFFNEDGARHAAADGPAGERIQYDARGNSVSSTWLDVSDKPMARADGFAEQRATFDENGYLTSWRWFDETGAPILYKDGRGADLITRDAQGGRLEWRSVDLNGAPVAYQGAAVRRYAYNVNGQQTSERYFDAAGKPVAGTVLGVAGYEQVYEPAANGAGRSLAVLSRWLAPGGGYALANSGVMIARHTYDANGNALTTRYLDEAGAPLADRNGDIGQDFSYSVYGQMVRSTTLGADAKPSPSKEIATELLAYDARGNITRVFGLDSQGEPALLSDGASGYRSVFDARDREILRISLGPDGADMITPQTPRSQMTYDAYDRLIRVDYQLGDARPAVLPTIGAAAISQRFDRWGRLVETTFLGPDGLPTLGAEGYAALRLTLDRYGREIARVYLDVQGQPVAPPTQGVAGWTTSYTATGLIARIRYHDAQGLPQMHAEVGAFGQDRAYDANGRLQSEFYISAVGALMTTREGVAGVRYDYDDRGRETLRAYLGEDRALTQPPGFAAQVITRYDVYGREIERLFKDVKGDIAPSPTSGRAIVRLRYDRMGRVIEEMSLGADGKPVNRTDEGWSRKTIAYPTHGQPVVRYLNATGQEVKGPP